MTSRTFLGVVALLLILLGAGNTRGIVELFFVWLGVDQALDWGRPPYHLPVFEWWEWPVWVPILAGTYALGALIAERRPPHKRRSLSPMGPWRILGVAVGVAVASGPALLLLLDRTDPYLHALNLLALPALCALALSVALAIWWASLRTGRSANESAAGEQQC